VRVYIAAVLISIVPIAFPQTPAPPANSWQTSDKLGAMDLSALSPAQKQAVLKLTREQDCSCLCGMKVAECVNRDPNCSYSKALVATSPKAHRPKLLEDPVTIPVSGSPTRGPADARITLVEFSDFECPYCSVAVGEVNTIMTAYPKDVRLIYKQFPLSMHPHAPLAAAASLAANQQGKFWQMHDALFKNFRKLSRENILALAKEIGLDMDKFTADLDSPKFKAVIEKDLADGETAGVYGTPSFFVNGKHYNGPLALDSIKPILDAELKVAKPHQVATTN